MKVAILFSGQIREIEENLFNQALNLFTEDIEAEIYISCWSKIGKSMNHKKENRERNNDDITVNDYIKKAFKNQKIRKIKIEDQESWWKNQPKQIRKIQEDKEFSFITKNSIPQLYKIWDSYRLVDNINNYDIIMRARFDSIFITPFRVDKIIKPNTIYNINFGNAFFPKRIYDIFFFCTPGGGEKVFKCWENLSKYVYSDFKNGLERRDACRLLFNAAENNQVNVETIDIRYTDIYRGEGYLKYLAKLYLWGINNSDLKLLIPRSSYYLIYKFLFKYKLIKVFLKYFYIFRWRQIDNLKYKDTNIL